MPTNIAVWPDGSWCWRNQIDSYRADMGLSDDYATYSADLKTGR